MITIRAGIVGSAGYTGGELIRLLLRHPGVEILYMHSLSSAGKKIWQVHRDLLGETERCFDSTILPGANVLFLCLGHGEAKSFLKKNAIPEAVRVIDLSQDFRIRKPSASHPADQTEREFTYGLPELNRNSIKAAKNIANPGCFATAIQLALLPLAEAGLLKDEIYVSAVTGSTGAGQSLAETTHFSWRAANLSVYKAFRHQHLAEISQTLATFVPQATRNINFIPYRGDFTRGIFASVYTRVAIDLPEALALYRHYYEGHPFTWVSNSPVDLKQVINTNKCFISLDEDEGKLLIISVIDNLLKGAAGQAVQNMNLMFDFDEKEALGLKSIVY